MLIFVRGFAVAVRFNRVCNVVHMVADTLHIDGKLQIYCARFRSAAAFCHTAKVGFLHRNVHSVGCGLLPFNVGQIVYVSARKQLTCVLVKVGYM